MKSWLEKNDTEMHSTHNEGESVASERFIRTLKNKIYKHMTAVSKNVYIDKLNDIVNEYNTRHYTIKMKSIDFQDNTLTFVKKFMIKILKSELEIMLEYQNTKNILDKG